MVEDQVETVTASFPSRAVFEQELARQNMSLPELKEQYRKVLREKFSRKKSWTGKSVPGLMSPNVKFVTTLNIFVKNFPPRR